MKSLRAWPVLIGAAVVAAACSPTETSIPFDRPALLALAEEGMQHELRSAERHILVVRHARKVAPDCNALDCGLSARGQAMVARLREVLGDQPVDAAYASSACRTMLTAAAGGLEPIPHQPVDGYTTGCEEGAEISRLRSDAFTEAHEGDARWTLAGEHSNTTCLWLAEFTDEIASGDAGCTDGRLPDDAYGHVYWLYQLEGNWNLTVIDGAFEVEDSD